MSNQPRHRERTRESSRFIDWRKQFILFLMSSVPSFQLSPPSLHRSVSLSISSASLSAFGISFPSPSLSLSLHLSLSISLSRREKSQLWCVLSGSIWNQCCQLFCVRTVTAGCPQLWHTVLSVSSPSLHSDTIHTLTNIRAHLKRHKAWHVQSCPKFRVRCSEWRMLPWWKNKVSLVL